jgi:acyl-CoA dehydrogenase
MLEKAGPDKAQDMDPSWSLPLGEMFSIVVYGQLILEQARLSSATDSRHPEPDV